MSTMFTAFDVRDVLGQTVADALAAHGFRPDRRLHVFRRDANELVHRVHLPLDVSGHDGAVFCTANVSVHCPPLEAMLAEHSADGQRPLAVSITRNIGQLSPDAEWRDWQCNDEVATRRTGREIATTVIEHALPWLARYRTLEAFHEQLDLAEHHGANAVLLTLLGRLMARRHEVPPPMSAKRMAAV